MKKNARPTEVKASAPGTGAAILSPVRPACETVTPGNASCVIGDFPRLKHTVRAEVLSRQLRGERMTGMEGVFKASTTRLAAVIHALESEWGWTFERQDKVVGASDGRIPTIREYRLNSDAIERAAAAGAGAWCAQVSAARRALRANAEQARRDAAKANAAAAARRRKAMTPVSGQADFFDGACP